MLTVNLGHMEGMEAISNGRPSDILRQVMGPGTPPDPLTGSERIEISLSY